MLPWKVFQALNHSLNAQKLRLDVAGDPFQIPYAPETSRAHWPRASIRLLSGRLDKKSAKQQRCHLVLGWSWMGVSPRVLLHGQ